MPAIWQAVGAVTDQLVRHGVVREPGLNPFVDDGLGRIWFLAWFSGLLLLPWLLAPDSSTPSPVRSPDRLRSNTSSREVFRNSSVVGGTFVVWPEFRRCPTRRRACRIPDDQFRLVLA